MRKISWLFVVLSLLFLSTSLCLAEGRLSDVDADIKKGVVEINDIMTEKDREKALDAINELAGKLAGMKKESEYSVWQNLERLEFYLSKYEWAKSRRILEGLMDDMGLQYEPTYD